MFLLDYTTYKFLNNLINAVQMLRQFEPQSVVQQISSVLGTARGHHYLWKIGGGMI